MAVRWGVGWGAKALVFALVAGVLFFGARLLRTEPQVAGGARYLVAKRGIAAFHVITGADVRWMENGVLPKGAFEHPEFLIGRVANRALAAGQIIREEDFAGPPGTQAGVSSRLKPNRVASAMPLSRLPGAQEILKPDDVIDILATRTNRGVVETKRIVSQARVLSISPAPEAADLSPTARGEGRGLLSVVDGFQAQMPALAGLGAPRDPGGWVILELQPQEAVELGRWPQLSLVLHGKLGPPQDDGSLLEPVELIEGSQPQLVIPESL